MVIVFAGLATVFFLVALILVALSDELRPTIVAMVCLVIAVVLTAYTIGFRFKPSG